MNEPENGVRAIQRLREMLLEERGRMVPVILEDVLYKDEGYNFKSIMVGGNKEALDTLLEKVNETKMYELCLTFRKRQSK